MQRLSVLPVLALSTLFACGDDSSELTSYHIKAGTPADEFTASALVDIYSADNKLVAFCSGALIAPSTVITAAHCVSGYAQFKVLFPYLNFEAQGTGEPHPNYKVGPGGSIAMNSDDVGLIFLDRRVSMPQYPIVRRSPLPDGTGVVNVGRVLDGTPSRKELYRSGVVQVKNGATISFSHDYVTTDAIQPGDSGGPTYRFQAPVQEVVAINSGAGNGFEVLAKVDLVSAWIMGRVNDRGGGFSLPPGFQPLVPHAPETQPLLFP